MFASGYVGRLNRAHKPQPKPQRRADLARCLAPRLHAATSLILMRAETSDENCGPVFTERSNNFLQVTEQRFLCRQQIEMPRELKCRENKLSVRFYQRDFN